MELEKDLIHHIIELIEQKDADKLKDVLADLHPADLAELCSELDTDEARFIFHQLDNEKAADVLVEMDD